MEAVQILQNYIKLFPFKSQLQTKSVKTKAFKIYPRRTIFSVILHARDMNGVKRSILITAVPQNWRQICSRRWMDLSKGKKHLYE